MQHVGAGISNGKCVLLVSDSKNALLETMLKGQFRNCEIGTATYDAIREMKRILAESTDAGDTVSRIGVLFDDFEAAEVSVFTRSSFVRSKINCSKVSKSKSMTVRARYDLCYWEVKCDGFGEYICDFCSDEIRMYSETIKIGEEAMYDAGDGEVFLLKLTEG